MQRPVGLHHFAQRAVHPKAHGGMLLIGLDVDVAGAIAYGLRQERIEQADDGCVIAGGQQVFHGRQLLQHLREVSVFLHLAHHGGGARLALGIGRADALRQPGWLGCFDMPHLELTHHFTPGAQGRLAGVPQGEVLAIAFQEQLKRACKRIRQRVACRHAQGPCLEGAGSAGWVPSRVSGAGFGAGAGQGSTGVSTGISKAGMPPVTGRGWRSWLGNMGPF